MGPKFLSSEILLKEATFHNDARNSIQSSLSAWCKADLLAEVIEQHPGLQQMSLKRCAIDTDSTLELATALLRSGRMLVCFPSLRSDFKSTQCLIQQNGTCGCNYQL
eukprot:248544-Amphidinium_carterae.1